MKYLGKTPEVEIFPRAYQKMMAYTEASDKNIGWVMEIEEFDGRIFTIEDVFLIPQKASYSEATLDKKFFDELDSSKSCYSGVGYSTGNSSVVPTVSDMNRFNTITAGLSWYIGVQMNKKGEFNLFFYNRKDNILFDNLDWAYSLDIYVTKDEAKADIEKFVTTTYGTSYNAKSYNDDNRFYASTYSYTAPKKDYPPSDLATKKPDISTLT